MSKVVPIPVDRARAIRAKMREVQVAVERDFDERRDSLGLLDAGYPPVDRIRATGQVRRAGALAPIHRVRTRSDGGQSAMRANLLSRA
jgi:hypothetical protein